MPVTLGELRTFIDTKMKEGEDPAQFRDKLQEVFNFINANESEMEPEALAHVDKIFSALTGAVEMMVSPLPDSPSKRKMLRLAARTKDKHHSAELLLAGMGRSLPKPFAVAEEARPIFLEALQSVLDLLFDATRHTQTGVSQFAILALFYWTIDELNTAFYLSERKYTTQAYSHLRTVYDLLEKADLFFKEPAWADIWGSKDDKKIRKELSPGAVREKLGRPKFDPVYSFLTEMGMHGTFGAVQKRVVRRIREKEERVSVSMWIGGVAWDIEVDVTISLCLFMVLSTLMMVAKVYDDRLNMEEVVTTLRALVERLVQFLEKHFSEPARKLGMDPSVIAATFEQLKTNFERTEKEAKAK